MQTPAAPEGLAALPPGPGLAAALHTIELTVLPNDRMLEVLQAQYRQLCHDQARMAATVAELGRCPGDQPAGQVARLPEPDRFAPDETRAALRWTRRAAQDEHDLAEAVVHTMPLLFAAWSAGRVDRPRVRVFVRYLCGLTLSQVQRICRIAVPRAPRLTTGQLAALLRRMVIAIDPDAAARWYRKAVREGDVIAYLAPDGTVTVSATGLPADQAEAACTRLQDLADAVKRAGHPGRIGEIRGAVFLGLLDGRFHHHTTAQIIAALLADARAAGHDEEQDAGSDDSTDDSTDDSSDGGTPSGGVSPTSTSGPPDPRPPEPGDPEPGDPEPGDPEPGDPEPGAPEPGAPEPGDPGENGSPTISPPERTSPADETSPTRRAGAGVPTGRDRGPAAAATDATATAEVADGVDRGCDGCTATDLRVGIEIRVGLATLLGRDQHPAELPGLGPLLAPHARTRVAQQRRAEWRFAVTGPDGRLLSEGHTRHRPTHITGHPVRPDGPPGGIVELHLTDTLLAELAATGSAPSDGWAEVIADIAAQHQHYPQHLHDIDSRPDDRHPAAALRRHTEIRDRTCTFPGCRRPARACDQDHTLDHRHGGPTVRANTGPACDHDHDVKHRAGWTVEQPEPGLFLWRSPLGGLYRTQGEFLHPELPEPDPVDPDPDPDLPTTRIEGPILQRPPPQQPPPDPPAAPGPDQDPPPF